MDLHSEYMEYSRERQQKARDLQFAEELEAFREARLQLIKAQDRRTSVMFALIAALLIGLVGMLWWVAR